MINSPSAGSIAISIASDDLARVLALYDEGHCLEAHDLATSLGPIASWAGPAARVVAGRLALNLGAPRLAVMHHLRAYREDPRDAEATYHYARTVFGRRGPLRAWELFREIGELPDAPDPIRADWYASHAVALGHLRDFDAADAWIARAEAARPEWPWVQVERSRLLEIEDRYEESLDAARLSIAIRPWYRPGVQSVAHSLQLLRRDREALDLLVEADSRIESGPMVAQLAALQSELGHHEDARRSFERYAELSPMMDKETRRWLAGRRSDAAYECGDLAGAAEFARDSDEPFFVKLAERLSRADPGAKRVALEVPFVRQHHQTCAPATLAAISRFWGMPADHLEVADAICYDGTPDHRERSWAEAHGWATREFAVDWDSTVALIDRGIPFTLTTVEAMSGHLQAVTGYDARRGTLLIRDPTLPHSGEAFGDGLLERYRSTGPRGMALVPKEKAGLLDGLELPDSTLYDHLYRMQCALREYDRDRAAESFEAMTEIDPGHRLTLQGRRVLAIDDADASGMLVALDRLLALFPDDPNFLLGKLSCLRDLARRDERLAILKGICDGPKSDALFLRQYAQELMADAREHPEATRLLRRVLRVRAIDDTAVYLLANIAWARGDFDPALDLYRVASCLDDKDEGLARSYFTAARNLNRTEETLRFLQARSRRFAGKSSRPARTLYWAFGQFERMPEAFGVLDEALELRPDDGELLLFTAEAQTDHGRFDRAHELLDSAIGHCRPGAWNRTAASLAVAEGRNVDALGLWRKVLDAEPSATDAVSMVARLLAETDGRESALDHLRRVCERFPHNSTVHQIYNSWLKEDGAGAAESVVRRIIEIHPADAWARRELALNLSEQGRHDEAIAEMATASLLDPRSSTEASVRAQILDHSGRRLESMEANREAIRRSIDNDFAIGRLVGSCDSLAERRDAIAFVEAELVRQVSFGDGLGAFARHARGILEPPELLGRLRLAWEARPDLWQSWSAMVGQLVAVGDLDGALAMAHRAIEKFPLHPRLRYDLSAVALAREDHEGEARALREALEISPGWSMAARQLSESLDRSGDLIGAEEVLARAVARSPLDAVNQGWLAEALWKLDRKDEAVDRLVRAIRLDPSYEWAWVMLRKYSSELDRPGTTAEIARELAANRAGEVRSWVRLARSLSGPEHLDERLESLDRALALDPRADEAIDLKADLLAAEGRLDEAEAACSTDAWGGPPPLYIRGRAAWIVARRGDVDRAITLMRAIVDEDPDYSWGWRNLAEWLCDHATPEEYLVAAEAMIRLDPEDAVALAYRAEALQKLDRRAEAKEGYRRAIAIAPTYDFAAMTLFDMHRDDGERGEADALLDHLKAHCPGDYTTAREVQVAVGRGELPVAIEGLKALCVSTGGADWPIKEADRVFEKAGLGKAAESVYAQALDRPEPPAREEVASFWVKRRVARRKLGRDPRLDRLFEAGTASGRLAMVTYLNRLADVAWTGSWSSMVVANRVSSCIRRHGFALRADATCWASVGHAYVRASRHGEAARWMSDWPVRDDAQPWMLMNLTIALRAIGRVEEARRLSARALGLPDDATTRYHSTILAFEEALDGDAEAASACLVGLDPSDFDALNTFFHACATAVVEVRREGPNAFARARQALKQAASRSGFDPDDLACVVKTYRRVVRRIAREVDSPMASAWALFRQAAPSVRSRSI